MHVTSISNRQRRREVTQKIELISPRFLLVASSQYPNGRAKELSSPPMATLLGPVSPLLHAMAQQGAPPPLAHSSRVGRRPSSCALPWVRGIPDPVSPLHVTRQVAAPPPAPGGRLGHRPSICVRRRRERLLRQGSWPREAAWRLQAAMQCGRGPHGAVQAGRADTVRVGCVQSSAAGPSKFGPCGLVSFPNF
jgi:hypothetical protein